MPDTVPPIAAPGMAPQGDPSQFLEMPYFLPVFPKDLKDPVVPGAIPLANPSSVDLSFTTPRSNIAGNFTLYGWYAWLAVVNQDPATQATAPLIWVEPNVGTFSSELPLAPGAPQVLGAGEGNRFEFTLQTASRTNTPINDTYSHTSYMLNPLSTAPLTIQPGAECLLSVKRRPCVNFFPDSPVYLFFGLFGSLAYNVPPPFKPDDCVQPVNPLEALGRDVVSSTSGGIGTFSNPTKGTVGINKEKPADIYAIRYAGADHAFVQVTFESGIGTLSSDPIPARIFNRIISGGILPVPIRVVGRTDVIFNYTQPIVVADQEAATGRFSLGAGIYGY